MQKTGTSFSFGVWINAMPQRTDCKDIIFNDYYSLAQIAEITGADLYQKGASPHVEIDFYLYDTRLGCPQGNGIFIALTGKLHDGHRYILEAYRLGIRNFLVGQVPAMPLPQDASILLHYEPLKALQTLAAYHRSRFKDLMLIGITGSNGKTIVKEWIASLAEGFIPLVKSPRSYNSRLGVALSLLNIRSEHRLAIIEAGISQKGEMEVLASMIRPNIGIFTHLGDAHAEGFESLHEKLSEKCLLFNDASAVIALSDTSYEKELESIIGRGKLITIGSGGNRWRVQYHQDGTIKINDLPPPVTNEQIIFKPPFTDEVSLQNTLLAIAGAKQAGIHILPERINHLQPVSMRMEIIDDNPDVTILNDAYNADRDSVIHAIQSLVHFKKHPKHLLILTDLEHQGTNREQVQTDLLHYAKKQLPDGEIILIGEVFYKMAKHFQGVKIFQSVEDCMTEISRWKFKDVNVLLKGARKYRLERLIPLINQKANATYLKINLNALKHNFLTLKGKIPTHFKTIAMIKASAYGSGAWHVAKELADCGADYFAVAFSGEGIDLRKQGIEQPIFILNPDESSFENLFRFRLEPVIGSWKALHRLCHILPDDPSATDWRFHLEFDTGMGRLGFAIQESASVLRFIEEKQMTQRLKSVFTHLASADDPSGYTFTINQLRQFNQVAQTFESVCSPDFFTHALNTAGIIRFASFSEPVLRSSQAVRMGIGLYGIDPTGLFPALEEVGSLHTVISQIHSYPAGTPVGYGGSTVTSRFTKVATLPVGYADGFPRCLGNRAYSVQVRGKACPTLGRICMDMLMIDVTDVPDVAEEDEVLIFGEGLSVTDMAKAAQTIPYEILARISGRVRRVYVKE